MKAQRHFFRRQLLRLFVFEYLSKKVQILHFFILIHIFIP